MSLHDLLHREALELRKSKLLAEVKEIEEKLKHLLGADKSPEPAPEPEPTPDPAPAAESKPSAKKSGKTS